MFLLIAGVVLFLLLGAAFAWRMKKATHYRGPGIDPSHQPSMNNDEHGHLHHDHHHHDHHHHHQETPIQHHTPPTVSPPTHNH